MTRSTVATLPAPAGDFGPDPGRRAAAPREEALRLDDLAPGDRLIVRTDSTTYDITVISPGRRQVIISGGPLFPRPVGVHLDGCSVDGQFLDMGAIGFGCALEFRTAHGLVVTGPVRSIGIVQR